MLSPLSQFEVVEEPSGGDMGIDGRPHDMDGASLLTKDMSIVKFAELVDICRRSNGFESLDDGSKRHFRSQTEWNDLSPLWRLSNLIQYRVNNGDGASARGSPSPPHLTPVSELSFYRSLPSEPIICCVDTDVDARTTIGKPGRFNLLRNVELVIWTKAATSMKSFPGQRFLSDSILDTASNYYSSARVMVFGRIGQNRAHSLILTMHDHFL